MIRRILALVVAASAIAAGLIFAPRFEWHIGSAVTLHEQTVKARDLSLVCPGPAFYSGGASGTSLADPKQAGTADVQAAWQTDSQVSLVGAVLGATGHQTADRFVSFASTQPYVFTISDPSGSAKQGSSLLTGVQLDAVTSPRMNGLLGSNCQRPESEFWVVGGDTSTGRESLLILMNPATIDATVELQLVGADGEVHAPGLSGVSVASGKTVVIPISSISPKNKTFSLHVLSHGAALAGWLQQKTVRGTIAAGADLIAPTEAAARQLVIPGFFVRGAKDAAKLAKTSEDFYDLENLVRLTNPGDSAATAIVQVIGASAKTFGTVLQAEVPAHSTVDLPVSGLSDGDYSIFIDSTSELLAAAKLNRTSLSAKQQTDFAWLVATEAATGQRSFVIPKAGISKLSLANPDKTPAEVTVSGGGLNQTFTLKPGSTRTLAVNPASVVSLQAAKAVAVSLVVDVDFTVAVIPMLEQRNLGGKVGVLVR